MKIEIGAERVITNSGTIIPQAVRFADGSMIVCYHTGADAAFAPCGAHLSRDDGATWAGMECPLQRVTAMGTIADAHAFFFNQYLFRIGAGEYVAFYNETRDAGRSFSGPKLARFHLEGVRDKCYDHDRAAHDWREQKGLDIPDFYRAVTEKHGAIIGGYLFGRVLRLTDGALGVSAYATQKECMVRKVKRPHIPEDREDHVQELSSALFFRSEDEGKTWRQASTIGAVRPGHPFDAGISYSEGFNETGLSLTSDGRLYALMRHGHFMLLWSAASSDGGRSWSRPAMFNYAGVAPSVTLLPEGILVAAWGRPGKTVGFSLDGAGRTWDVLVGIKPELPIGQDYLWLLSAGKGRLFCFYDDSRLSEKKGVYAERRISFREIRIEA